MRKPRQSGVVKRQLRLAAAGLARNWTPPSPSPPEPTGRCFRRRGSRCFSEEEEELLIKLHALLGNRWSLIAGRLPGRTGKEVESHWNSTMRRKLSRMGVDPDNHRSMTDLLASPHDEQQRRRRPLDLCKAECAAKHPNDRRLSSDDCVSDPESYCRARQELACGLNLELTLATPCLYLGG